MIVEHIERLYRDEGLTYRQLCTREGVRYSSFMRWRSRGKEGKLAVQRPGPKKVEPLDLDALRDQVQGLRHGRKRSAGSGKLYQQHRQGISRRDLRKLVAQERQRKNRERNRIYHQVRWRVPRLIWAMDDTGYHPDKAYPKAYLHNTQDLGSQYKFEPLVGLALACGQEVAGHLVELFEVHGPPLFIKRDNHGNLNNRHVEEVLEAFLVIPVNSPCHYPQYNGGIEACQRQIKERLRDHRQVPHAFLAIQAELDMQALNHKRLGSLGNRTACEVFTQGLALARTFNRRKRKEVYDWIREKTLELIGKRRYEADAAWRIAVETWLLDNGFITVSKQRKVLPHFPENRSHN